MIGKIVDALNPINGIKDAITDIVHAFKGDPAVLKELQLREMEARTRIELAKAEIRTALEKAWMEDAASLREQAKVELSSEDPFVRRARPAWLWGLLALYLTNYGLTGIASWFDPSIHPIDIPTDVHLLAGLLVGGYGYLRTVEKRGAKPPLAR